MPWPYISSKNKVSSSTARSGTALSAIDRNITDDDNALMSGLSLEEEDESSHSRRGASLDIPRASLNALTPFTSSPANATKARRSSFPRLALPSWRQQPPSSSSSPSSPTTIKIKPSTSSLSRSLHSSRRTSLALDDGGSDDEAQGVELQEGYGTPYTANGLKGGFQLSNPPSNSLSGSASIASTSSSSRKSQHSNLFSLLSGSSGSNRTSSDEYSLEGHPLTDDKASSAGIEDDPLVRQSSISRNHASNSSDVTPIVDSGFSEFGPHTVVAQEEERLKSVNLNSHNEPNARNVTMHPSSSSSDAPYINPEENDSNDVVVPKKARSRGWFSFNSSSKQSESNADDTTAASTPKNERDIVSSSAAESIAETHSSGSTETGAPSQTVTTASSLPPTPSKKTKQCTPSKGFNIMKSAGRKRGDSEVSMKEMTNLS